jgi:hypothetical protein
MIQILELDQQYMVQAPTATTKVAIYLQNDEVIQCELFCFTLLLSSIKECIFGFFKKISFFALEICHPPSVQLSCPVVMLHDMKTQVVKNINSLDLIMEDSKEDI